MEVERFVLHREQRIRATSIGTSLTGLVNFKNRMVTFTKVCNFTSYVSVDFTALQGTFQNGLREGFGVQVIKQTGERYEGHWQQNLRHGNGNLLYHEDAYGRIEYQGLWAENKKRQEVVSLLSDILYFPQRSRQTNFCQ